MKLLYRKLANDLFSRLITSAMAVLVGYGYSQEVLNDLTVGLSAGTVIILDMIFNKAAK